MSDESVWWPSVIPPHTKISTVGAAPGVGHVDLAIPQFPEPFKPVGYIDQIQSLKFSWPESMTAVMGEAILSSKPITPTENHLLPEGLCGNCRRDWHEIPLTETLARMWDSCSFDESYDPAGDNSRVLCPGSECCGPALPRSRGWDTEGIYISTTIALANAADTLKIPQTPPWLVWSGDLDAANPSLGEWTFAPPPPPMEALPSITASTWLPGDDIEQAALEAAPKAIEMAHLAPQPPGFDFSAYNDTPGYPKKGKKKK